VLNVAAQSTRCALTALLPVLPEKAAAGLQQLGVNVGAAPLTGAAWDPLPAGHRVGQGQPLFPKVESK
jgi:methionyl-tRNA synthetase